MFHKYILAYYLFYMDLNKKLIHNLLANLPIKYILSDNKNIDIILEGGLFNGSYLVGVLMFIKEMEKKNYICVKRISGCSVGSAIGFLYFIDKLEYSERIHDLFAEYFRMYNHLHILTSIKSFFFKIDPQLKLIDVKSILDNKLFISYHKFDNRLNTCDKIIKSKYENIDDLFESIIRSSFVPILINTRILYKKKYLDGITPYIFNNNISTNKILYLNLSNIDKIEYMINIKNEKNPHHRVLTGILDIHLCFIKNKSNSICSFIHNWSLLDKLYIYCRNNVFEKFVIHFILLILVSSKFFAKYTCSSIIKPFHHFCKELYVMLYKKYIMDMIL